jgi:hypothetical protein
VTRLIIAGRKYRARPRGDIFIGDSELEKEGGHDSLSPLVKHTLVRGGGEGRI